MFDIEWIRQQYKAADRFKPMTLVEGLKGEARIDLLEQRGNYTNIKIVQVNNLCWAIYLPTRDDILLVLRSTWLTMQLYHTQIVWLEMHTCRNDYMKYNVPAQDNLKHWGSQYPTAESVLSCFVCIVFVIICMYSFVYVLYLLQAKLDIMYGVHHTKMIILRYKTGIRIMITTANLVPLDWFQKSQALWCSPLCPKGIYQYTYINI